FVLRHFAKGYSFPSRVLYKKELGSYQKEWETCKAGFDPKTLPDFFDFTPFMESSGLATGTFNLPDKRTAKAVRRKLSPYLRLPQHKLGWLRFKSFQKRLWNKLFYKRKKVFPNKGFILAFSGADGVGKSTMSEQVKEIYKSFL